MRWSPGKEATGLTKIIYLCPDICQMLPFFLFLSLWEHLWVNKNISWVYKAVQIEWIKKESRCSLKEMFAYPWGIGSVGTPPIFLGA